MSTIKKPAANRVMKIPGVVARILQTPTHSEGVNVHPADELADVRDEIKRLQSRADELRDQLLAEGADLKGDTYTAEITPGVRETLDRKALTEAYGEAAVLPFIKKTAFNTVKLVEHGDAEA